MTQMQTYDSRRIPKELVGNDPYHPAADLYMKNLTAIQKAIVDQSLNMKKDIVMAAKLHHRGLSYAGIGAEVKRTPTWVAKYIKTDDAQRLIALLAYYQEAIDGPTESARRAGLARIWHKNEDKQPKVALSAIAELNKMDNIGKEAQIAAGIGNNVTVVINTQLGRTELDG